MTGNQFRLLRKMNNISQATLFHKIGKGDRNSIYRAEHLPYVPLVYLRALGEIIGVNLTKPEEAEKYMKQLGVKPPPIRNEAIDWKPIFDEYKCTSFKWERLLTGYRRCLNKRITRNDFVDILYQALERGELRQIAHGNGVRYVYNAPDTRDIELIKSKTRSKMPKNGTFDDETASETEE